MLILFELIRTNPEGDDTMAKAAAKKKAPAKKTAKKVAKKPAAKKKRAA